jgi:hypothetical protein
MIDRCSKRVFIAVVASSLLACGGSSPGGTSTGTSAGAGGGGTSTSSAGTGGSSTGGSSSTSTSTSTGSGAGGASGSGGSASIWASLSDEFDDPSTLGDWKRRDVEEGTPAQYSALDIDTTHPGALVIFPTEGLWKDGSVGPFVYKLVTGDFVVETSVGAHGSSDGTGNPVGAFSLAGLMIRDPQSGPLAESWLMIAAGRAGALVGSTHLVTHASLTTVSASAGPVRGLLRLCRLGPSVAMYTKLEGAVSWVLHGTFPQGVGPQFEFALPDTVEVGLAASAGQGASMFAHFEHIRFAPVMGGDCLSPILPE